MPKLSELIVCLLLALLMASMFVYAIDRTIEIEEKQVAGVKP